MESSPGGMRRVSLLEMQPAVVEFLGKVDDFERGLWIPESYRSLGSSIEAIAFALDAWTDAARKVFRRLSAEDERARKLSYEKNRLRRDEGGAPSARLRELDQGTRLAAWTFARQLERQGWSIRELAGFESFCAVLDPNMRFALLLSGLAQVVYCSLGSESEPWSHFALEKDAKFSFCALWNELSLGHHKHVVRARRKGLGGDDWRDHRIELVIEVAIEQPPDVAAEPIHVRPQPKLGHAEPEALEKLRTLFAGFPWEGWEDNRARAVVGLVDFFDGNSTLESFECSIGSIEPEVLYRCLLHVRGRPDVADVRVLVDAPPLRLADELAEAEKGVADAADPSKLFVVGRDYFDVRLKRAQDELARARLDGRETSWFHARSIVLSTSLHDNMIWTLFPAGFRPLEVVPLTTNALATANPPFHVPPGYEVFEVRW